LDQLPASQPLVHPVRAPLQTGLRAGWSAGAGCRLAACPAQTP